MTNELRPGGKEGAREGNFGEQIILGNGNNKTRGFEVGASLVCSRTARPGWMDVMSEANRWAMGSDMQEEPAPTGSCRPW